MAKALHPARDGMLVKKKILPTVSPRRGDTAPTGFRFYEVIDSEYGSFTNMLSLTGQYMLLYESYTFDTEGATSR